MARLYPGLFLIEDYCRAEDWREGCVMFPHLRTEPPRTIQIIKGMSLVVLHLFIPVRIIRTRSVSSCFWYFLLSTQITRPSHTVEFLRTTSREINKKHLMLKETVQFNKHLMSLNARWFIVDPRTIWVWTAQVHLHVDFPSNDSIGL